jgi:hypothetical protein
VELHRKVRKHTEYIASLRRRGAVALPVFFTVIATLAWQYVSILASIILMVLSIFGLLLCNPYNIRRFIPGLNSVSPIIRALSALLYLSAVLAVIGIAGN